MRHKKIPIRLPYSDELLAQRSLAQQSPTEVLPKLIAVQASSKQITKSNKPTAIVDIKQQKRLKLQKYRDKLLSEPKKSAVLDEDDECLIDFLRKYNEYHETQKSQSYCQSTSEPEASYSRGKKSPKKTRLTKLQRVMKDLECTMVQGHTLPNVSHSSKSKKVEAARRGILKSKKMNLLRNYRQKQTAIEREEAQVKETLEDVDMIARSDVDERRGDNLDEFKLKLVSSVIEKDELEETLSSFKTKLELESKDEDTPISVLIKSNEMQMMKSNGLDNENDVDNGSDAEDAHVEVEIVDEAIRKKIEKQLHIDVTDKYNFAKQTARTKLRPKCTPDFEMNKRCRKNRFRGAKNLKLKKTNLLSKNTCGQNHFLGFDKSIKRFKDEQNTSDACDRSLVNRSYFNWDSYTVPTRVRQIETSDSRNVTAVSFRDELDFLQYSLAYKKSQSTLNQRLRQRLQLWMRMCKTRKDLQKAPSDRSLSGKSFYLIENEDCAELNCDTSAELLGCDSRAVMLAVPGSSACPYLKVDQECVASWRRHVQSGDHVSQSSESRAVKREMRNFIRRMIRAKQLRCNSTYAAYDISAQNVTNLYEDEHDKSADMTSETSDCQEDVSSCKTSRISYYTSGSYVKVSVNLQTPVKRRRSDAMDSEASSCDQLPQAHIEKIEEMFTDSNDTDCVVNDTDYVVNDTDCVVNDIDCVFNDTNCTANSNDKCAEACNIAQTKNLREMNLVESIVKLQETTDSAEANLSAGSGVDNSSEGFVNNLSEGSGVKNSSEGYGVNNSSEGSGVSNSSGGSGVSNLSEGSGVNSSEGFGVNNSSEGSGVNYSNEGSGVNSSEGFGVNNSIEGSSVKYERQIKANLLISNKPEHNGLISSFLDYGNGQNTKRKKKSRRRCKQKVQRKGALKKRLDKRDARQWGKLLESAAADELRSRQRARHSDFSADESNSSSYGSMYDLVKTKTRLGGVAKSVFNFEFKFPPKDRDVFYAPLMMTSSVPVLALYGKTKRPLADLLSPCTVLGGRKESLGGAKSAPANWAMKLLVCVIYVKSFYWVIFTRLVVHPLRH